MKTANGMSSTLGPSSIGFGSGFKGGEGDGRSVPLNAASGALGNRFERSGGFGLLGGLLSNRPFGVIGADGARTGILADMFNGGGRSASGNTFQGGLLSGLLNAIGIRPIGFSQTQQPQMTEEQVRAQMGNAPSVMAPSPAVTQPAVTPAVAPDPYSPRGRAAPMSASPEYFSPGLPAPGATIAAPQGPTMFGGQGPADRPYVDMSQPEFGTIRPGVSRVGGRIPPMMGFTPNVNTRSTPRPAGMGLGPDAGRAAQLRAFREMQARAAARPLGMGGLLGR